MRHEEWFCRRILKDGIDFFHGKKSSEKKISKEVFFRKIKEFRRIKLSDEDDKKKFFGNALLMEDHSKKRSHSE